MKKLIVNNIAFPEFTGIKCNMMPFIQGDSSSLPKEYNAYSSIIDENYIEKGEIGYLTIDEKFVEAGKSQRGFNSFGIDRNVHIEVGRHKDINCWGGGTISTWGGGSVNSWGGGSVNTWGGRSYKTILEDSTMVLIANSISGTCRIWDKLETRPTKDGDLSEYIDDYPEDSGIVLNSGELVKINILSPHECINQQLSSNRQFFRIIGKGVKGREDYFTINPLLKN